MVQKLLAFLKRSKGASGHVGLEIRPDGLSIAIRNGAEAQQSVHVVYQPCSAAEREQALTKIIAEHGLDGMPCRAVLPFDQYKIYPIDKPEVEASELADAARWRIKDMLDFDLDDAVSDVYSFPADALRGRPEQLNVVVSRRTIIENTVNLIQSSGLELESIDIADLALRNIVLQHAPESERATAILYLRRGVGMMVFVKQEQLYLARHFDFSLESLSDPSQQDSVIQYLSLEIQRSFDYFESQLGQIPPQELVLYGPDPNIPLGNMLGGSISAKITSLHLPALDSQEPLDSIQCLVAAGAAMRQEVA